jgi:hypothetical protein
VTTWRSSAASRRNGGEARSGPRTDPPRQTFTGVTARTRDGKHLRTRARVVGADGIRSTIADAVGAPFERLGRSVAATTYGYWTGLDTAGYEWNFRPNAASGVIPTNDGQTCVFANASPQRIGRGGLDPLTRIVTQSSGDLAERLAAASCCPAPSPATRRPRHTVRQAVRRQGRHRRPPLDRQADPRPAARPQSRHGRRTRRARRPPPAETRGGCRTSDELTMTCRSMLDSHPRTLLSIERASDTVTTIVSSTVNAIITSRDAAD